MPKNIHDILSYIPQREPFVMVDEILHVDEIFTRSKFLVRTENIFVKNGQFKEPGLVENIAQTAAARAGYISRTENKPVLVGYIGAIKNLQIFYLPKTGDELITEVTIEQQIFTVTLISGKIFCDDKIVAQCEMKIFINGN